MRPKYQLSRAFHGKYNMQVSKILTQHR